MMDGRALLDFIRAERGWFWRGPMIEPWESRTVAKLDRWLEERDRSLNASDPRSEERGPDD